MQDGEDTRVSPPPVDDLLWTRLIAAPSGELYELSKLVAAVRRARERGRGTSARGARLPRAGDPQMGELRAFCRDRALPLPPRLDRGRGMRGILQALSALRGGRTPDRVLVLSQRPTSVVRTYEIDLPGARTDMMEARKSPGFQDYVRAIWDDLQAATSK